MVQQIKQFRYNMLLFQEHKEYPNYKELRL